MNDTATNERAQRLRQRGRTGFRIWIGFIVLGIIALGLLHWWGPWLADHQFPSLESGARNLATYVYVIIVWVWGTILVLQFGGLTWRTRCGRAAVLAIAGFSVPLLFEPIFDGGLGMRGLRPRFWGAPIVLGTAAGSADLAPESSSDYPQFLGEGRDGRYDGIELNPDWQRTPPALIWRQPIGQGWSSFATRNGFAVTMQQLGDQECVTCYKVDDGSLVWNYAIRRRHENILGGVGPRSTPTIHDGRVYAQGALGNVCCLDGATGKPIWEVDLLQLAGIPVVESKNGRGEAIQTEQSVVMWGRAASPLVIDDRVILPLGGSNTVVALNAEDGSVIWRGGDGQPPSYSSPAAGRLNDRRQIILVNEGTVTGYDAADGTELWGHLHHGSSSADANTSQATLLGRDRILLSKGYGLGGEVIEIVVGGTSKEMRDGQEQAVESLHANTIWKSQRVLRTKLTNPVIRDGYAYAISNEVLECVDLTDGARRWRAPERFGHGQVALVGKFLVVHTEDGELLLVDAAPAAYAERGRIKTIAGVCWNTIAFFDDKVLLRSDVEAACFRLPVVSGGIDRSGAAADSVVTGENEISEPATAQ